MSEVTGGSEEHAWQFSHEGDDVKADIVASAATTLTNKMKELFAADGLIAQMVEKAKERGPADFPKRRARYIRHARLINGDLGESPWLPWIFALLLLVVFGGGVVLYKLYAIQKEQDDHEQRISRLERNTANGAP